MQPKPHLFRVALLQMQSCGFNQEAALRKGDLFCRQAAKQGADLALFPEMWNIGYEIFDDPGWSAYSISPDSAFFLHFQQLAQELEMAIALTYLGRTAQGITDSVAIFDYRGKHVLTYHKVHTCDFFESEQQLVAGDGFVVADMETATGNVRLGTLICFDCFFPESARLLMLQGADIILAPNADGFNSAKHALFRTRSYENKLGFATANYAAPTCNGQSVAFDGIEYDEEGQSRDTCLAQATAEESLPIATFDIAALRRYRQREVYGNSWRRPTQYGALCVVDSNSRVPLLRKHSRC